MTVDKKEISLEKVSLERILLHCTEVKFRPVLDRYFSHGNDVCVDRGEWRRWLQRLRRESAEEPEQRVSFVLVLKDSPRLLLDASLPHRLGPETLAHYPILHHLCSTEKGLTLTERTDRMEVEKDKDLTLDTLEVLLNPGLIKTKACLNSKFAF